MNVGLAVTRNARRAPHATAVFDDRGQISHAELDARGNRFAHLATGHFGLRRGDRVALLVPNRREVVEVMSGAAKAGLVYVGLNFRLDTGELRAVLANAQPRLVVTEASFAESVRPLAEELRCPVLVMDDPGPQGYEQLLAAASADAVAQRYEGSHHDEFCLVYSSGTTGVPKGILFDHAAALQHGTVAALEYDIDADSRYLVQIPHNSSVHITMVPCLLVGAAIGFGESRGFDPQEFAERVQRERVTHSFLVPTMLFRLLEKVDDASRLASLRTLGYGSSSIPADRVRALVARFGPIFIQLYGMAEIASIGTLLRKDDHVRGLRDQPELLSSAGRPSYAVEVRVVDPRGRDVAPGERGEVVFGGPHLMRGYYRDPQRSAEALVDGWMHSGDVGVFDSQGYLYIVDRIKDLIIRGGFNIAPREIEEVLYQHPAVLEAAVVGVPDSEWGEELRGVVALKDGQEASGEELVEWCRSAELSSIKIPARIEVTGELPKNQVGKIAKNVLRERYTSQGGAS